METLAPFAFFALNGTYPKRVILNIVRS
jgi:hypothetical protein